MPKFGIAGREIGYVSTMNEVSGKNREIVLLLPLILMALVGRLFFLDQPMRYDESFTFLVFANRDLATAFYYPLPNNHVLHTLLVKLATWICGGAPAIIRLPAFVSGILSVPLIFLLCRKLIPGNSGFMAGVAVALWPYLIFYSTNARGYSLLVAISLALFILAVDFANRLSFTGCVTMSLLAAFGMLTIPTMLFVVASVYCWVTSVLLINGNRIGFVLWHFALPCSLMTAMLTFLLYLPTAIITGGFDVMTSSSFVASQPFGSFLEGIAGHFAQTSELLLSDVPGVVVGCLVAFFVLGVLASIHKRNWSLIMVIPSILIGSGIPLLLKHSIPYPRTWIFVVPFVLLVVDAGFTYAASLLPDRFKSMPFFTLLFCGFLLLGSLIVRDPISYYSETGHFAEAEMVAKAMEPYIQDNYTFVAKEPADFPTLYYLWRDGLLNKAAKAAGTEFFIVKKSGYSIGDLTNRPFLLKIFELGDAVLYKNVH